MLITVRGARYEDLNGRSAKVKACKSFRRCEVIYREMKCKGKILKMIFLKLCLYVRYIWPYGHF